MEAERNNHGPYWFIKLPPVAIEVKYLLSDIFSLEIGVTEPVFIFHAVFPLKRFNSLEEIASGGGIIPRSNNPFTMAGMWHFCQWESISTLSACAPNILKISQFRQS
jgi:hypothetical protein